MKSPDVSPEHRWLHQLLGQWTWASEAVPGQDHGHHHRGTEEGRPVGDIWVELAGAGDYGISRMTIGFEPVRGRFWGTWVGGMMNHLWVYDGALQEDGKTLVLEATGPAFDGNGMALYRDVVQVIGPEERTLQAFVQGADGAWTHFMTTHYRRVSAAV